MVSHRIASLVGFVSLAALGLTIPLEATTSLEIKKTPIPPACNFKLRSDGIAQQVIWDRNGLGVGQYLDNWIRKNGEIDWLSRMHEQLYSGGESTMHCVTLGANDCQGPSSDDCREYRHWSTIYAQDRGC
jgi:hypothetical protein